VFAFDDSYPTIGGRSADLPFASSDCGIKQVLGRLDFSVTTAPGASLRGKMDRTEEQGEFDAWLQETWGGSDPFSFLMRATWSKEYHEDWDVSGLTAIEERGHLLV
jgi:hypothetical protein